MSATLASPLKTGSTVPGLTPVTVPWRRPTWAWTHAAPSSSAMANGDLLRVFMSALRDRVGRRVAGDGELYWGGGDFGYRSPSCVDLTRWAPAHAKAKKPGCYRSRSVGLANRQSLHT